MDDEWVRREVRIPKGTHLSKSKDSAGAERDLLREDGTNRLLGPTESRSIEGDDLLRAYPYESGPSPDLGEPELPLLAGLAEAAITGFVHGLIESIDWEVVFEHHVTPAAKRTKDRVTSSVRSTFKRTKTEVIAFTPEASVRSSTQVDTDPNAATFVLSKDEYRQRSIAAPAAAAFAAQQRKILANSVSKRMTSQKSSCEPSRCYLRGTPRRLHKTSLRQ